ncbi:protein translocase subunit SecF [Candidatus Rariloculus sp.]|uniref:protein translocase subunit SecF n=1 Tax=Candidatus Rariloculus sp. TaxID=3101265 RepID=UPI003D106927
MPLFNKTPNFDFMGPRRLATGISVILIGASLISILVRGLNLGVEFTSGVLLEVGYETAIDLESVRATLNSEGYENSRVQFFGAATDVLIRLPPVENVEEGASLGEQAFVALQARDPSVELRRVEFVGPQVGEDLREQGGLAMLFALIMIFAYVMLRFRWKFAAGAIAALVHDVVITLGFFSIVGLSFDLSILAAVLAVIGYSLNDTIVIYDRIRENFRLIRRGTAVDIINTSINQTLARTLITGITTLFVLLALLFLGGETVYGFSVALITGVLIGTYSSIYVASSAALALDVSPTDLILQKREEADEMP